MEKLQILKEILRYSHSISDEHLFWCELCPKMHHKPKLSINLNKNYYKCWVCESSGKNLYYLVKKFGTFEDCQRWLEFSDEVDITEFDVVFGNIQKSEKIVKKLELPKNFKTLSTCESSHDAYRYMVTRNFNNVDMIRWRVGYCEEGLYGGRIVFPSFDMEGNVNFFTTRSYLKHFQSYKNPKIQKKPIFNEFEVDWWKEVVLVEGPFDMVKFENCCPLLGNTLSENSELFKKIIKFKPVTYLGLDKDAILNSINIIKTLLNYEVPVKLIDFRPYKDPGVITFEECQKRKKNAEMITFENIITLEILNV